MMGRGTSRERKQLGFRHAYRILREPWAIGGKGWELEWAGCHSLAFTLLLVMNITNSLSLYFLICRIWNIERPYLPCVSLEARSLQRWHGEGVSHSAYQHMIQAQPVLGPPPLTYIPSSPAALFCDVPIWRCRPAQSWVSLFLIILIFQNIHPSTDTFHASFVLPDTSATLFYTVQGSEELSPPPTQDPVADSWQPRSWVSSLLITLGTENLSEWPLGPSHGLACTLLPALTLLGLIWSASQSSPEHIPGTLISKAAVLSFF